MKNIYNIKWFLALMVLISMVGFQACKKNEVTLKERTRNSSDDIDTYAKLFDVVWHTMDDSYNYFYEQKRKDGYDWDQIYKIYAPKFAALKGLRLFEQTGMSNQDVVNNADSAKKFFTDIIDPIIDRHFVITISLPTSKGGYGDIQIFRGGMKTGAGTPTGTFPFGKKAAFISKLLVDSQSFVFQNDELTFFGGPLISDPDIYYISFNTFRVSTYASLDQIPSRIWDYDVKNSHVLPKNFGTTNEKLATISDPTLRAQIAKISQTYIDTIYHYADGSDMKRFNELLTKFKTTEDGMEEIAPLSNKLFLETKRIYNYLVDVQRYASVFNTNEQTKAYKTYLYAKLNDFVLFGFDKEAYDGVLRKINACADLYINFYAPLRKGKIKKLIYDVRGNGGGSLLDMNALVYRLINTEKTFIYQRTKEGNTRFDYTPWVPSVVRTSPFGMPSPIPIAILTDRNSVSMSEISSEALKSQGPQVFSVGDTTRGATAGLTNSIDEYNGGAQVGVGGDYQSYQGSSLYFYFPVMASKDMNGNVIEGVGIAPTYPVAKLTDEEVKAINSGFTGFTDRTFNKAIEILRTK